jgi:4Fe-4S ferredoxin
MKRYKTEHDGKLVVGHTMYTKRFVLTLDRNLCKGCELCKLACPREALTLVPVEDKEGKACASIVDIDENKCDFHGICAVVCPFSAIKININGDDKLPAVTMNVFPTLERDIEVRGDMCEAGCKKCEEVCPLGIISVECGQDSGNMVNIDKDLCAGCQICMMECPADAINMTKFIEGSIEIDCEACPEGCHRCFDVFPLNALQIDKNGKVSANNMYCIFCGACLPVCPNPDALRISRTAVRHTDVSSGAWNRGLKKITSTSGLMRELAAQRVDKVREAIRNLEMSVKGE